MALSFYFDIHVHHAVAHGLGRRGIDVLTGQDDGSDGKPDTHVLHRATELDRIFVTYDDDFLSIASQWSSLGREFTGMTFVNQASVSIRRDIDDLELIAWIYEPRDIANTVIHVPF